MKCPVCGCKTSVVETRRHDEYGYIYRRRRGCDSCGNRFNTFEILDGIKQTIEKYVNSHSKAVRNRYMTRERNLRIVKMLNDGEKVSVVANEFGLTDNMVGRIAREYGVLPYRERLRAASKAEEHCPRPE